MEKGFLSKQKIIMCVIGVVVLAVCATLSYRAGYSNGYAKAESLNYVQDVPQSWINSGSAVDDSFLGEGEPRKLDF